MAERKFKVKCIAISLKKNKIARATEEVTESQLAGDPDALIKGGYITEIKTRKKAEPKKVEPVKVEPVKVEPVKVEPKVEPVKVEATKDK